MIYFIHKPDANVVKIGYSTDPKKRLAQLQTGHHEPLSLIGTIDGGPMEEAALHERFAGKRLHGEWFNCDPDLMGSIGSLIDPDPEPAEELPEPVPYLGIIPTGCWPGSEIQHQIVCPFCGFEYAHVGSPSLVAGNDNYGAGWGGRGDLVIVPFWGECGHLWELCFGFHKGETFAFVRNK